MATTPRRPPRRWLTVQRQRASEPKDRQRAQTPLMIHRQDMLAEARAAGSPMPACSPAIWAKVKASFQALPPERKRLLEMEAEATKGMAKRARAAAKSKAKAQPSSRCSAPTIPELAIVLDETDRSALVPAAEQVRRPGAIVSLAETLADPNRQALLASPEALQTAADQEVPNYQLSQDVIRRFFCKGSSFGDEGCGVEEANRRWAAISETVAPAADFHEGDLVIDTECGCVCKQSSQAEAVEMFSLLTGSFSVMAKAWSVSKLHRDVAQADVICAFEVFARPVGRRSVRADMVFFVSMSVAIGKVGPLEARTTFALMEPQEEQAELQSPFAGARLRHRYHTSVLPEFDLSSPFSMSGAATAGETSTSTEDEFAAILVKCFSNGRLPGDVRCRRLRWTWDGSSRGIDHVVVEGVKGEAINCLARRAPAPKQKAKKKQEDDFNFLVAIMSAQASATRSTWAAAASSRGGGDEVAAQELGDQDENIMQDMIDQLEDALLGAAGMVSDEEHEELRSYLLQTDAVDEHEEEDAQELAEETGADDVSSAAHAAESSNGGDQDPAPQALVQQPAVEAVTLLESMQSQAAALGFLQYPEGSMNFYIPTPNSEDIVGNTGRKYIGNIRQVKASWKATCKAGHGSSCALFLTPKTFDACIATKDLLSWLSQGQSCSAVDHEEAAYRLKTEKYKMRVRRRT